MPIRPTSSSAVLRAALCDFNGMALATELSDILFGTPSPVVSEADLGVINKNAVNIAVNGHNPLVAEAICQIAESKQAKAKALGAQDGINIVGVCCTGNEALLRHGVPMAANYLSQGDGHRHWRGGRHGGRRSVHHAGHHGDCRQLPYGGHHDP